MFTKICRDEGTGKKEEGEGEWNSAGGERRVVTSILLPRRNNIIILIDHLQQAELFGLLLSGMVGTIVAPPGSLLLPELLSGNCFCDTMR